MNTNTKTPGRTARLLGYLGIGLCGLCCSLPIIGITGGAGLLSGLAFYAEKIAILLLVASVVAFGIAFYRKKNIPACDTDCNCKSVGSNHGNHK
jgi:hypothetical protein